MKAVRELRPNSPPLLQLRVYRVMLSIKSTVQNMEEFRVLLFTNFQRKESVFAFSHFLTPGLINFLGFFNAVIVVFSLLHLKHRAETIVFDKI